MKRTEKKLKSKGIKAHKPSSARAYWCYKYDRNYVAKCEEEITHLPFSRASKRSGWMLWYEHPNISLWHYLKTCFFPKHVGMNINEVFHDFSELGWKNSHDMYYYWDEFVDSHCIYCYQVTEDGCLQSPPSKNRSSPSFASVNTNDNDEEKPKAVRRHASEKRLIRKQLEHNESVKVPCIDKNGSKDPYPEFMGTFFVEHKHKVIKVPVYHINYPVRPEYKTFSWRSSNNYYIRGFTPVKILGRYREELKFEQHYWRTTIVTQFNEKEKILDAEIVNYDTGPGELTPSISYHEAQQLLAKVTK